MEKTDWLSNRRIRRRHQPHGTEKTEPSRNGYATNQTVPKHNLWEPNL